MNNSRSWETRAWNVLALLCLGLSITFAIPSGHVEAAMFAAEVLADNPIGYWRLNETSGTTAFDSSGNERDGTYVDGVTLGATGGLPGDDAAASFDGLSGYVQLPGVWGNTSAVTVEAFVNVQAARSSDIQAIVSSTTISFLHFQLDDEGGNNVVYGRGALLPNIGENPLNVWRHVALVSKPGFSQLYVDGQPFGPSSSAGGLTITSSPDNGVRIGSGYNQIRFFDGLVDEVAIYDTALSEERILKHFKATPEPSTLMSLTIGGIGGLLLLLRRRRVV